MSQVRTEQDGRVVVATLDNPPHALMTMEMVRELGALVERWEADDSVGAVVLTGAHPDRFLAHFDVSALLAGAKASPSLPTAAIQSALAAVGGASRVAKVAEVLAGTPAAGLVEIVDFQRTMLAMGRSGVVYVAAVNGSTMGGGCELSLACDVRLMTHGEGHRIGQVEMALGFPPGGGGTQRLARLLGEARALELTLDPAPITPERALEIGLVSRVVEPDELLDVATELAARYARRSKTGARATKRAIRDGASLPLAQGLRLEASQFMSAATQPDAIRLMEAYVARFAELGEVPAYDPDSRDAFVDGTVVDLSR